MPGMTARQLRDRVIDQVVEELNELKRARDALEKSDLDSAGTYLERARRRVLGLDVSVSVARAAGMLRVSEPTVRDWVEAGILKVAVERPLQLTFASVIETRDELEKLRRGAITGNVRQALLHRIEDRQTLEDSRLKRSVRQMHGGRRHYVHRRDQS